MSRCVIPLLGALVSSLAPAAASAQQTLAFAPASLPPASSTVGVRWSMPLNNVTRHAPSWSATDVGLASGFLAILWVDAAQTRSIARNSWEGFQEANPLIGPRPTVSQINTYTAAAAVGTLGIAAVLPQRARRWWLMTALAVEAYTVYHTTARMGISLRMH